MGADIAGACGQLVVSKEKGASVGDIEDGPFRNTKNESAKGKQIKKIHRSIGKKEDDKDDKNNSNDHLDKWIRPLAVATSVSVIVCVLASAAILLQRRKR